MITFTKTFLLATAAAVMLPMMATADTIKLSNTYDSGLGIFGDPRLFDTVKIGADNMDDLNVYAGGFHVSSANESFNAWCIDLAENLILPFTYDVVTSPFLDSTSDNLSKLFTGYIDEIDRGVEAAAFQVSIWELISDTSIDLDAGEFQLLSNQAVEDMANGYLAGLSVFDADYDMQYFTKAGTQDLVTGTLSPVPLPATGLLLLVGLGGLALAKCKLA